MFVSSSKRKSFAKKIIGLKRVALLHTNFVRLISRGPKYTGKPLGSACAFICSFCSWRMSGPCLISPWRALWRTMDKQSHIRKVVSLNKHILLSIRAAVNNSFQYTFFIWLTRVVSLKCRKSPDLKSIWTQILADHCLVWAPLCTSEGTNATSTSLRPPLTSVSPAAVTLLERWSRISLFKSLLNMVGNLESDVQKIFDKKQ